MSGSETGSKSGPKNETQDDIPWIEKYRPKKLDDISSQDRTVTVLRRALQTANLPHMLFYGPPGTGKTSTILALARELFGPHLFRSRVLELNASDERGINIVREKVKNFARLAVSTPSKSDLESYPCPPYKIIILDEADSMTQDAQSALRRTMETYSTVTRFCLVCNYVTRIIDPIASRCSKFRFKPLEQSAALERLSYIASNESLNINDKTLNFLLSASEGDLRRAITFLQSSQLISSNSDSLSENDLREITGVISDSDIQSLLSPLSLAAKRKPYLEKVQDIVSQFIYAGWNSSQALLQLADAVLTYQIFSDKQKAQVSLLLSDADHKLTAGAEEKLVLLNLIIRMCLIVSP